MSFTRTERRQRRTSIEPPDKAPYLDPPEEEAPDPTARHSVDDEVDPSAYYDDSDEGGEELEPLDFN